MAWGSLERLDKGMESVCGSCRACDNAGGGEGEKQGGADNGGETLEHKKMNKALIS